MVPFGSAAFFPGRLIHTNEFLVLLGDAYYAERTSKQTVEILKRREKTLESQMGALKASLLDLETEAKFFNSTAAEAEEGIVEIREEYTEEPQDPQEDIMEIREEYTESAQNVSESGPPGSNSMTTSTFPDEEDEHHRIMAMLDGLEKEELEAGSDEDSESGLETESVSGNDEDENSEASASDATGKISENLKPTEAVQKSRGLEVLPSTAKSIGSGSHQHLPDRPYGSSNIIEKETARTGFSDHKAFTGSVIEHTHSLPSKQPANTSMDQPTKPVSRFKMMKGNR
ncbi:uncharacterized protein A4U43_C04F15440 [Asparagus officinalis]|uniref:Uncharacterized protein n=1 Tax=Asparagus officinalis TaxID=4686 RepID=A0A5P1F127_ASPOF|nr:RNA polymerase II subunit 5-mediating protein homolog isoform X2 [Asparagus officinalis]XP_020261170.1 RNA polymerase II subunit 5-mediating protein homolog isoform X2 [Asparagus officinalis]XP_020261171.1 RNA polymerase II subunit 5-mediating protein homolog isoform X2 [Asparagus officinalis]XP_020261172.1 RNA polymerase II subunit 5-mediating protein homolog isoform X2 [Asparagus officinalis]ONK72076.1 uncharacterized protein A4U43_C04F15440 [Asparagus officinalis]